MTEPVTVRCTQDLSDAFFAKLRAACERIGASPFDVLGVMMNESGVRADAKNPTADANGLIQFMGDTLKGLGWEGTSEAFRRLSAEEQVPYVEAYFAPHKGKLGSPAACYLCTFLPALLAHAGDMTFVLCAALGPLAWAYAANKGFDRAGNGHITVQDLAYAIDRACTGPRWNEIAVRMQAEIDGSKA